MEYQKVEPHWEDAIKEGNLKAALDFLEVEIALNLCKVHNYFSDNEIRVKDVYVFALFEEVKDEKKDAFKPFADLNFDFITACHGRDDDSPLSSEELIEEFKEIKKKLEEMMKNI